MTDRPRHRPRALSLPVIGLLVALLAVGPVGLLLTPRSRAAPRAQSRSLQAIARDAGCRYTEFDADPTSNPPVSGRVDERVYAADGSYVGRPSPSRLASVHALLHGRVVLQYRPDLPAEQIAALGAAVARTPSRTLLFANRSGMPYAVAATAYLALMTCPAANARTLPALMEFRARRVGFGQSF